MAKRMSKGELPEMATLGALNPVDHAILAFADSDAADKARDALRDAGFEDADVLSYTSGELFPNLEDMMRSTSGAAGFGYEVVLMRRYHALAQENASWLVVYAPDDERVAKVKDVASRGAARSAVRYGRLLHEDLI